MFKWMPGNTYAMQATLYENNITLNNPAAAKFSDYRWCMIGFDEDNCQMAIKGISHHDMELNLVPKENLNKVSIGKGYARISNKNMVNVAQRMVGRHCIGEKFPAHYDEKEKILIIDLFEGKEAEG